MSITAHSLASSRRVADHAEAGGAPAGTPFVEGIGARTPRPRRAAFSHPRLGDLASRLDVIAHRIRTLGLVRAAEDLVSISAELRRLGLGQADDADPR
jgi:hypothetical protein